MNNNIKYSLLVDRYLSGEMDDSEKILFEKEVINNKVLQKELELEEDINRILSMDDMIDFRIKVAEVIREARAKQKRIKVITLSRRQVIFAAAAAVVLIFLTVSALLLLPQRSTSEKLFAMYYDSDKPIRVTRSGDDNLVEALRCYQQKNYGDAIELFDEILVTDPDNAAVRFYAGISYIEISQYEKAIESFQYIINENDHLYIEPSQWHLGLCYIKSDQMEKAKDQFNLIAGDERNYYKEDADKIIEEMQNMN